MTESPQPLVELRHIHKRFPGVYALRDVSLTIRPGEIHALMGENGAGKSTLIKIMAGVYQADEGSYLIEGRPAEVATPHDAIAKGISVIYQELNLLGNMTVAENVALGGFPVDGMGRVKKRELRARVADTLARMELDIDLDSRLDYLPVAKQQLVEIAKSLYKNPRLLIMDEPTSSLSAAEIESLFGVIKRLAESGVGIVYVSHKIEEIFRLCNRVTVLRDGQMAGCDSVKNLTPDRLVAMMVGRPFESLYERKCGHAPGEVLLDVKNLSSDRVRDVTFQVRAGEIVGFFGLMGAGRTELARAIFGADQRTGGTVAVDGKPLTGKAKTNQSARLGLGFMTENRKEEGIIPTQDVRRNMSIASLGQITRFSGVDRVKEHGLVNAMINRLKIKASGVGQNISNLSGGNQQKVILARWLIKTGLRVLIVDEPTRGIDVGAKSEIYAFLDELAAAGLGVMCITSEMNEVLSVCDRIYVMKEGRISGECPRSEATPERLFTLAALENKH